MISMIFYNDSSVNSLGYFYLIGTLLIFGAIYFLKLIIKSLHV
jgi:hypothetical protein